MLPFALAVLCAPLALALWPNPHSITTGSSALKLSPGFSISVNIQNAPADLGAAVQRTEQFLKTDQLERLVVGRGDVDASAVAKAPSLSRLNVALASGRTARPIATETIADLTTRDESYSLTVPTQGDATLTANTTLGLLRGLTTFNQLFYSHGSDIYTIEAPISIVDKSAFPYRGFMLDTARNFFPVSDIMRAIDTMSLVKLNTLHWHATDSQSWPLEIPAVPELVQGAYSSSQVYSVSDIDSIISYAAERGVDVMLEIDTPGHTAAISSSHPDLVACFEAPWASFANEPPAGQLRFMLPEATQLIQNTFGALAKQFPSALFSTGGDELNVACYTDDAVSQAQLQKAGQTLEQALNSFTLATHGVLEKAGKTPVVWEEMALDHNVTLSNNTAVLVWVSSADAALVAAKNLRIIHAPSNFFYLDCGGGEWVNSAAGGTSWCDPFKTWQLIYSFDPLDSIPVSQQHLVLGGETLLWTEQSDPSNLDPIAWPRAAVAAEVFWTGANQPNGSPRNSTEALPRLHDVRYRMVQRGVNAIALQPQWCAIRPGQCTF